MPTMLIADDNEDLRGMLGQLFESHGYAVKEAADGGGGRDGDFYRLGLQPA